MQVNENFFNLSETKSLERFVKMTYQISYLILPSFNWEKKDVPLESCSHPTLWILINILSRKH